MSKGQEDPQSQIEPSSILNQRLFVSSRSVKGTMGSSDLFFKYIGVTNFLLLYMHND